ncbi:MAG: hypothetical protein QOC95_44 [Thermoleophilaceae bacterium]|nr:hypothetical protein [Thermoleophilaceae bacterium]
MGRRGRKREKAGTGPPPSTTDYTDSDGNVLTLRDDLSAGTVRQLANQGGKAAASQEDMWQRRGELLFERLAVSWEISGLPLTGQKELLGRYRMADGDTRRWVRDTLERHVSAKHPELQL